MSGVKRGSGQRSGLYSSQRLTNWTAYDPFCAEASSLPAWIRPRLAVASVSIYERRLASGFVRPRSAADVAGVLAEVPPEYLSGLAGVYLLGGTVAQMRRTTRTFGLYQDGRAYLFPVPTAFLDGFPVRGLRPSGIQPFLTAGATITGGRSGVDTLHFDAASLRNFYLYDVLLHEIGHHIEGERSRGDSERFAHWFSEVQRSRLFHDRLR